VATRRPRRDRPGPWTTTVYYGDRAIVVAEHASRAEAVAGHEWAVDQTNAAIQESLDALAEVLNPIEWN